MVSGQILEWFPQIQAVNYAFTSSDHCKIACDISNSEEKIGAPFKFEKMWMKRKDFRNIVKQA